ncbi:MAG TPA: 6-carboxytetrahydropterin synthase QueD [Firmicutes bacterium]|nr:6-carboxytetrahydropterin synthase QueD [Bacillota bacterium]
MFEIRVRESFSAAHQIEGYKGKCEKLHGHNWSVEITVSSQRLDKKGMVFDFVLLRKKLRKVLSRLDHSMLNRIGFFKSRNTTAEYIAYYIFLEMNKHFGKKSAVKLSSVAVSETDKADAVYASNE